MFRVRASLLCENRFFTLYKRLYCR